MARSPKHKVSGVGWKVNSADGKLLTKLLKKGKINKASPPQEVKEMYPMFKKYKSDSFASGLRRLKGKLGLNNRNPPGNNTDDNEDDADEVISLGSDDTDPSTEEDVDDDEEVELGEPTEGVPSVARAPPAAVSVRSPFAGHSVVAPSIRQPGTLAAPPMVTYCWNPPHLKTVYTDFGNLNHQFVAFLLPSGVGYHDDSDLRLSMSVYGGADYYLTLEIQWPDTFEKDDGKKFLSFLKVKTLKRKVRKWLDKKSLAEQARAKKEFESLWVMLEMAVKQEMIRMRNAKGTTTLRSQTCVKMDFPVERLTEDCWELIGDAKTGVRMLVVDLEQATENEESKPASFERKVEMIGMDME